MRPVDATCSTVTRAMWRGAQVAAAVGFCSGVAAAQRPDSTADSSAARRLGTVRVTETRAVTTIGGAAATVVDTDRPRASPAPVLSQLLRETPFLTVRLNSRGETELSVRGSDSRQAAILLEGVPLSVGWDHRTDASLIPVTGADELVVVRGLGTLLAGPNTLGGTVSVSQMSQRATAGSRRVWGGLGIDDNAAYVTSLGAERAFAAGAGTLQLRAAAALRDRDGLALPGGAADATAKDGLRTNSDSRQADAFVAARWRGVRGRSVGITLTGFDASRGVPPEEHLANPRLWRYPFVTRGVAALAANLGAFDTPWGIGTLDVSIGHNSGRQRIESFSNRTYSTVTAEEQGNERTTTVRTVATHSLPRNARISAGFTIADVRYTETLTGSVPADYRQILRSTGVELDAPLGLRTTIASGLVLDRADTPESGGREPGQPPLDNSGWRLGIMHDATDRWRFHASASQRSRFPALRELYSGALNRFRPNPDLRPETLLGYEAGATLRGAVGRDATFNAQITAFRHRLDDAVVRITLTNPTRFMRVNRDRIESNGAEAQFGYSRGDDPSRSFSAAADVMVQRLRIVDQTAAGVTRRAENNPEFRANVSVDVPIAWEAKFSAALRHTGVQYCLHAETGADVKLSSASVSDLSVERDFAFRRRGMFSAMRAVFGIDNAADATVYDQCGLPQPGRTLRAMVTFR